MNARASALRYGRIVRVEWFANAASVDWRNYFRPNATTEVCVPM
jgi:hypothetical protein